LNINTVIRKYCLASLLGAVYLTSTVGIFSSLYLSLHRSAFQECVVESIPSTTEKLFFSVADFSKIEWIEKGKELKLKGKLYDVSKIERTVQGFAVYGVNDSLEEEFIAMVDQWKKNSAPSSKGRTLFQPQFCNRLDFENSNRLGGIQVEFLFDSGTYTSPISLTPSPPPKVHS